MRSTQFSMMADRSEWEPYSDQRYCYQWGWDKKMSYYAAIQASETTNVSCTHIYPSLFNVERSYLLLSSGLLLPNFFGVSGEIWNRFRSDYPISMLPKITFLFYYFFILFNIILIFFIIFIFETIYLILTKSTQKNINNNKTTQFDFWRRIKDHH